MHRKHIRATDAGTGTDVDVPTAIWADGQFLIYLGGELFTQFVVQSHNTSTDNAVARWDGTTGHLIQDSTVIIDDAGAVTGVTTMNGVPPGDWVRGPAAGGSTDNAITRWDGTTGRLVQNSVVVINDTGDITGVTSINTVPVGDFVRGPTPATATDEYFARWDGTSGRLIQDSIIHCSDTGNASGFNNIGTTTINSRVPARWVDGPLTAGTVTNNHVALWDTATGRLIKDSPVTIDPTTGDITTPGDMTPATVGGVGVGLLVKSGSATPHPNNSIAKWSNGAGNPIVDSVLFVDGSGNATGFLTINTRQPNLWVEGPVSAVANNIPIFNGTSGRIVYDSGLSIDVVVEGPGLSTDNAVARWDGTSGFAIQNSLVIIDDTGAITGATTLNTKTIANIVVKGLGSYAVNGVPYFNDTTGTVIRDSGVNINNVVRNESGVVSVDNTIPRFDGITGKLIQNSGIVVADTSNNVTGLGTLNTRVIADWVSGPATATNNGIPAFNGTSGKAVYDSGVDVTALVQSTVSSTDNAVVRWDGATGRITQNSVVTIADTTGNMAGVGTLNTRTIANWVDGPASATDNAVARFDATTGKLIQNSAVTIADTTGNITGGTYNGVSVDAHASRHIPGGSDSLFSGSYSDGSIPEWDTGTSKFVPSSANRYFKATGTISGFLGTTGFDLVPTTTFALGGTSPSELHVFATFNYALGDTGSDFQFTVSWSGMSASNGCGVSSGISGFVTTTSGATGTLDTATGQMAAAGTIVLSGKFTLSSGSPTFRVFAKSTGATHTMFGGVLYATQHGVAPSI